jgi:hypothetical protein
MLKVTERKIRSVVKRKPLVSFDELCDLLGYVDVTGSLRRMVKSMVNRNLLVFTKEGRINHYSLPNKPMGRQTDGLKLSDEDVITIRQLLRAGASRQDLADRFSVSYIYIYDIEKNHRRNNITMEVVSPV